MVRAQELTEKYHGLYREELLRKLLQEFRGRIAIASSFGTESWALLQIVANIDPATIIIFTNTGKILKETLEYLEELASRLELTNVRMIGPTDAAVEAVDKTGTLWKTDKDRCCDVRKAIPFEDALRRHGIEVYISGRRREHGGVRTNMPIFENDGLGHVRVNLIADMTSAELTREFVKSGLPPHPLIAKGLTSVGCDSCTVRSLDPSDSRGGRLELGKPGDGRKMHGECNMHGFEEEEKEAQE